jgi:type IV pilus assembly protein PilM
MSILKRNAKAAAPTVGLDIDPGHVAAVEVHVNGGIAISRAAVAPLRPGVLRDGELSDAAGLTAALSELWSEHDLPRRVRIGVANQRIVVRTLDVAPLTDPGALAAAVRVEAPDHIPMPMDEVVLDFQPLGNVETPAGPRVRVVVVAVRRAMVTQLNDACTAAGLELVGIDLSAFAMVRALAAGTGGAATLYVNAAGLLNVAVANDIGCLFTRAAPGGVEGIASTLAERRGLTQEHARGWLQHVGLAVPAEDVEGDTELVSDVRHALEDGVHEIADSVRNSLNFYRGQESAELVERAVLTGPALAIPGFTEELSKLLEMPVEPGVVSTEIEDAETGRLTVAAGLAVSETT